MGDCGGAHQRCRSRRGGEGERIEGMSDDQIEKLIKPGRRFRSIDAVDRGDNHLSTPLAQDLGCVIQRLAMLLQDDSLT